MSSLTEIIGDPIFYIILLAILLIIRYVKYNRLKDQISNVNNTLLKEKAANTEAQSELNRIIYQKHNSIIEKDEILSSLNHEKSQLKTEINNKNIEIKRMEALVHRNSLEPHFFKNLISGIDSYAKVLQDSLSSMIPILEYIIYDSKTDKISVSKEILFLKSFMDYIKIDTDPGFEIKLQYDIETTDRLANYYMMPLTFTNIVENIYKYSDKKSSDGHIQCTLNFDQQNKLYFTALNTKGRQSTGKKGGFGLENLHKRLALFYGDEYQLHSSETHDNEYKTELIIQLYKDELESNSY